MSSKTILMVTAMAPIIWGSSYFVTTEFLPQGYPLTLAMLRALPVGVLLLMFCRQLPTGSWWLKVLVLGALNFSIFWWLLFVSAYRLPGGVAATISAIQPLLVIFLARLFLGSPIQATAIAAAVIGLAGVALLLLTPSGALDNIGLMAGLGGAVSMACGTVLSKRWMSVPGEKQVSPLTFTAWQLIAGGLLLLPAAMVLEPALPSLSATNVLGFVYLGLIGAGLTYLLWFNGLAKLSPAMIAPLGFLSPVTAVLIGWLALNQSLTPLQFIGAGIVLFSVWLSQRVPSEKNKPQLNEINSKQFT